MKEITNLWWVNVVRGITAIIFGIMMLVWPYYSIFIVAVLFASLLLVFGISDIITGFIAISKGGIGFVGRILLGILEAGTGAFLFYKAGSGLTLKLIGLLVAVNLIVIAIVNVSIAFIDKEDSTGYRWMIGITGVLSFLIGVVVAENPAVAAASLIWVFGVFGLFYGPLEIASGVMLKRINDENK